MPDPAEALAGVVDRVANGPLRGVVQGAVELAQWKDPIQVARIALFAVVCWPNAFAPWYIHQFQWSLLAGNVTHQVMFWIHEGGHLAVAPIFRGSEFGQMVIHAAGGGAEVFVVLLVMAGVWQTGARFGAYLCLWWLGLTLMGIARYAHDGKDRLLPGPFWDPYMGGHDWWNILQYWGLLLWAQPIGYLIWLLGCAAFVGAMVGCFREADPA